MGSKIYGKNQIKYTIKTIRKENIDSKISINDKFFTKIKLKQGEWAYWAGMVDGDGAIKENCDFILRLTDKNIIINLAKIYGCKVRRMRYQSEARQDMYMIYFGRNKRKHFMFHIYPYLIEKKEKVRNYIKKVFPKFIDTEPNKFGLGYDELVCKMGYTAGFFDAEGSAGIYRSKKDSTLKAQVNMTNSNTLPLKKIQSFFHEAPFNFPLKQIPIRVARKPKMLKSGNIGKISYSLNLAGNKRFAFMAIMLPYLKCERKKLVAKKIKLLAKVIKYTNPKRSNMPNLPVWKNKLELLEGMRSLDEA